VESRVGELLSQFAAKAMEVIQRILDWCRKAWMWLSGQREVVKKRYITTIGLAEANASLKAQAESAAFQSVAHNPDVQRAKAAWDQAILQYNAQGNNLMQAFLTEAPILGVLKATSLVMPTMVHLVVARVRGALSFLSKQRPEHLDKMAEASLRQQFANYGAALDIPELDRARSKMVEFKDDRSMMAFFTHLKAVVEDKAKHLGGVMPWEMAITQVVRPDGTLAEPIVLLPDLGYEFQKALDDVRAAQSSLMAKNYQESSYSALYEQMYSQMIEDTRAILVYAEAAQLTVKTQRDLIGNLYACEVAQFEYYRAIGIATRDPSFTESLNAAQLKLRSIIKA
jgi:hypothetical protein